MFGNRPRVSAYALNQNANYRPNFGPAYYQTYHQSALMVNPHDDSSQDESIHSILINRKSNEEFLRHFVGKADELCDTNRKASKISETRSALLSIKSLNTTLLKLSVDLKDENLSQEVWDQKVKACEETKEKIEKLLQGLKDEEFLKNVKKSLERRKKKRLREKRMRENWKATKIELQEKRNRLHNEADIWIKSRQNVIDKEKQEENLRREADLVLFDVRAKRSDARKYLTLLKELENLRRVKVTIAKARGELISSAADEAFNNIIEKLTQQWIALDREYSIEEQGLKLMIKTDNESKIEKQKINSYDSWETALFGKKIGNDYFLPGDMGHFITIRSAWDTFLNAAEGTPIPIGWIVPNKPSSGAWQKCLKKE